MQTFTYGTTPDNVIRKAAEQECPDGFDIGMREGGGDFEAVQTAVNQGIDSYLEAVRFTESTDRNGRRWFVFDADTLHVLCRRLGESDDENAQDFRQSILQCLEIEEI